MADPTPPYELPPLRRALGPELVPRLLPVGASLPPTAAASTDRVAAGDLARFLDAVLGTSEDAAVDLVDGLVARGVSAEGVYLDLLAPTARALGELWNDDACDFVEVTVALGRLQRVLRRLSRIFLSAGDATRPSTGRALLSCIPGEQHTLGLFMVAEFLIRDGWVVSVGAPVLEADLLDLLRTEWFDVIGFSVACDSHLSRLTREIRRVRAASRNPSIGVLVGGRPFNDQPGLVARVGADSSAADAREAAAAARRFVISISSGDTSAGPQQE